MKTFFELHKWFVKRSITIIDRAKKVQQEITVLEHWKINYLTEGIISDLWRHWSCFCRNVIMLSCGGTINRMGRSIAPRIGDNSWQRIGYEAACAVRGKNISHSKKLQYRRQEPTWGDQTRIIDIINVVKPSNSQVLITAFGLPFRGPRHLQLVRNACAHKDVESMQDVRKLLIYYTSPGISSPCDVAWQIEVGSKLCGIYSWVEDLRIIALEVTKA